MSDKIELTDEQKDFLHLLHSFEPWFKFWNVMEELKPLDPWGKPGRSSGTRWLSTWGEVLMIAAKTIEEDGGKA